MSKIQWNETGKKFYETGIDRAVFYPQSGPGVAWNGVTSVSLDRTNRDPSELYMDGIKYHEEAPKGGFAGSIEAYTYPTEFEEYDGYRQIGSIMFDNQIRKRFNLCYRTRIGNDIQGMDFGYKIHFVYNILATSSSATFDTINESPDVSSISWDITTVPVFVEGLYPTSHLTIDTRSIDPIVLGLLEGYLYGDLSMDPRMPWPDELMDILDGQGQLKIFDNNNGTWTALGSDEFVSYNNSSEFVITADTVIMIDDDTFTVSDSTS